MRMHYNSDFQGPRKESPRVDNAMITVTEYWFNIGKKLIL